MNHAAVKAVSMDTLNRQRANIVFSTLLDNSKILTPENVSRRELIFERDGVLRWGIQSIGRAKIGVSLQTLLTSFGPAHSMTSSYRNGSIELERLLEVFRLEDYLLWFDSSHRAAYIVLKEGASASSQLKAWAHSLWAARRYQIDHATGAESSEQGTLQLLTSTLGELSSRWETDMDSLTAAGWDIGTASLETTSATRISLSEGVKSADLPQRRVINQAINGTP